MRLFPSPALPNLSFLSLASFFIILPFLSLPGSDRQVQPGGLGTAVSFLSGWDPGRALAADAFFYVF